MAQPPSQLPRRQKRLLALKRCAGGRFSEKSIPDIWDENEHRAMDILKACRESVDSIPNELMQATKTLLERNPVMFERTAMSLTQSIGFGFWPTNAANLCEILIQNLEKNSVRASVCVITRCQMSDVLPLRRAILSSMQISKKCLSVQQKVYRATPSLGVVVGYDHLQATRKYYVRAGRN